MNDHYLISRLDSLEQALKDLEHQTRISNILCVLAQIALLAALLVAWIKL